MCEKWGGFVDRGKIWPDKLLADVNMADERTRYWNRLQVVFDRCEGCEKLLCGHVYAFGASFLRIPAEEQEEETLSAAIWDAHFFATHGVSGQEEKDSIKRVLMVLEEDLDLDYAPMVPDLVALLSLHLSEVQVYAAVRRLITVSSSRFVLLPRKRKRTHLTPRRFVAGDFRATVLIPLTFWLCVQRADPKLHATLIESEVKTWFERWLIPILPMNQVIVMLDCMLAGDDVKTMFKLCMSALRVARPTLLASVTHPETHSSTGIVRDALISQRLVPSGALFTTNKLPKRKALMAMEREMTNTGKPPPKHPVVHVNRDAFSSSQTGADV